MLDTCTTNENAPTKKQLFKYAERAELVATILKLGTLGSNTAEGRRQVCEKARALLGDLLEDMGARPGGTAAHAHEVAKNAAALRHCAETLQGKDAQAAFVVSTAAEALGKTALSMLGAIGRPAQ